MLHKIDKDRLDKVLKIIEEAKIKFPNATISKELGEDNGSVSNYLNGKKPMSTKFYTNFMEKYCNGIEKELTYGDDIANDNSSISKTIIIELAKSNGIIAEANRDLVRANIVIAESNKELSSNNTRLINTHLISSDKHQHEAAQAANWRVVELLAANGAGGLWKTKDEGVEVLGKLLISQIAETKK